MRTIQPDAGYLFPARPGMQEVVVGVVEVRERGSEFGWREWVFVMIFLHVAYWPRRQ